MAEPAKPKPRKRRKRLLLTLVVSLIVLGGGAAGAVWLAHRPARPVEKPQAAEHGVVSFEPFVVNLADQGGTRFLRVSIRLILETQEEAEKVKKSEVALIRLRSAVLELLTQQTADRLVTLEGKSALKQAIAGRATAALEGAKVTDVLFSDFVVQF